MSVCSNQSCCHVGIDTRTGSTVTVERPVYFDAAVKKLGLQHALGSLRLVRFDSSSPAASNENMDVVNMPAPAQQADKQRTGSQEGQSDDESPWVPLHLQLGLPLTPAELCDLVCRYIRDLCCSLAKRNYCVVHCLWLNSHLHV